MAIGGKVYDGVIVAALAFGFSSNFIFMFGPNGTDVAAMSVRAAFNVLALFLPAFYAYYRKTSLKQLLCVLLVLSFLDFVLFWAPIASPPYVGDAVDGLTKGTSVIMTGSALYQLRPEKMRPNIILGFALSVLVIPFVHLATDAPNDLVKPTLFALYLAAVLFVVLKADPSLSVFSEATGTIEKLGGMRAASRIMFAQQMSATLMVIIATLLSTILGMFASFSSINGYVLASSDATLLLVFSIVLIMYVASLVKPASTWFNALFSFLMLASIAGLFAALMVSGLPTILSSYFSIMLVIAMIPVCVFAIEFAREKGLSPVFVCGTMPLLINAMYHFGYLLNLVFYEGLGEGLYDVSKLAAASLACIAGIVIILFVVVSKRAADRRAPEKTEDDKDGGDEGAIAWLTADLGLTRREAQIALMFAQGRSAPYISQHFYLAESTVKSHLKRIYAKLDVHNKQDLLDLVNTHRR